MTNISKQVANNSATISFTNFLNSAYSHYLLVINNVQPVTNNVILQMVWSTNGGSSYINTGYVWAATYNNSGGFSGLNDSTGTGITSSLRIQDALPNTSTLATNFNVNLFNLGSSTLVPSYNGMGCNIDTGPSIGVPTIAGGFVSSENVNAIQLAMSSGNIAAGTFILYGVTLN
jgi:hypothetical protein